jgi:hypothetical protein
MLHLILEQCAQLVALSEDYRNRVWEERNLGVTDLVAQWDLGGYRLADARLHLLSSDETVLTASRALHRAGVNLGVAWRTTPRSDGEIDTAWTNHKQAINDFIDASRTAFGTTT